MFGRETRMLLRHYLEQGTSKSALARQLGVHRDTIHRRIRDGEAGSRSRQRAGPLWTAAAGADQARRLQADHRRATHRLP